MHAKTAKSPKVAACHQRHRILKIRRRARGQQPQCRRCRACRAAAAAADRLQPTVGAPSDPHLPRWALWGARSDRPSSIPLQAAAMAPRMLAQLKRAPPLRLPPMPWPHRRSGRSLARRGSQSTCQSSAATFNAAIKCCRARVTLIARGHTPARRAAVAFVGERSPRRADFCPCPHASRHRPRCARTPQPQQLDLDRLHRAEPWPRCHCTMPRRMRTLAAARRVCAAAAASANPTEEASVVCHLPKCQLFARMLRQLNPRMGTRFLADLGFLRPPRLTLNAAVCSKPRAPRVMLGGGSKKGSRGGGRAQG